MNFGNLFIVGFNSLTLTDELKYKLNLLRPAGVILYDCNIDSKEQVQELIHELRELLGDGLLISVDQEGGKVQRLRKITSNLPSLKSLAKAALQDDKFLELHSKILAYELKELGFNLVYAPCADLNTNPQNPIIGTRSLGDDTKIVSQQLVEIHNFYREAGIISCAKHFPGHGDTGEDSHLDLPVVVRTKEINDKHLEPFKALIRNHIEMIMIAHIVINDGLPASINQELIGKLRKDLGYKGLIISDEITMKALVKFGNYNQLAELLIKAGNNLIIWNTNLDDALQSAEYLNNIDSAQLHLSHEHSIKLIQELKIYPALAQSPISLSQEALLEIAQSGIEFHNSHWKDKLKEGDLVKSDFAIIINEHPKLERTIIEEVFSGTKVQHIDELDEDLSLLENKKFILIEFQIQESKFQLFSKKINTMNFLHVSTDLSHKNADMNLNGASKVHYRALRKLIDI
jgi:beta-N-acetylhexosaminidase